MNIIKKFFQGLSNEVYFFMEDPVGNIAGFCFYFGIGFGSYMLIDWIAS